MSDVVVRTIDKINLWPFTRFQLVHHFPYFTTFVEDLSTEGQQHEIDLPPQVHPQIFDTLYRCIVAKCTKQITDSNFLHVLKSINFLQASDSFDQVLADAIDRGTVFFRSSRVEMEIGDEEGELFAKSATYLWKYDYFPHLREAFINLLIWISGRAVHAPWFNKLPFQMIKDLVLIPRKSVGLLGDVTLIALHALKSLLDVQDNDQNRANFEREMSTSMFVSLHPMLYILSSLLCERSDFPTNTFSYYRNMIRLWSERCGVQEKEVLRVLNRSTRAIFDVDESDSDSFYSYTSMECAKEFLKELQYESSVYLCKNFIHVKPSWQAYGKSYLICHDDRLWEYNPYVRLYRLLCLSPKDFFCGKEVTQKITLIKPTQTLALTVQRRSKTDLRHDIIVWLLDFTNISAPNYKWKRREALVQATDDVYFPRIAHGNFLTRCPAYFFFKQKIESQIYWWLHVVGKSKSIKFLSKCDSFSAALHPLCSKSLDSNDSSPVKGSSIGMYLVMYQYDEMTVHDYEIIFKDKDVSEISSIKLPECPKDFNGKDMGCVSVFYDNLMQGPLIVSSVFQQNGVFCLKVLRKSSDDGKYWDTITITIPNNVSSKRNNNRKPFGGEFKGRLNDNELVIWGAVDFFNGRRLFINLSSKTSKWSKWGIETLTEKNMQLEELKKSLSQEMPIVSLALPALEYESKKTSLISDQVLIPSTREHFWLYKSRNNTDGCEIENLETVKWETDNHISFCID